MKTFYINVLTAIVLLFSFIQCQKATGPNTSVETDEQVTTDLLSPSDGADEKPTTLTLKWEALSSTSSYQLQVSTDNAFSSIVIDEILEDTSYEVSGLDNDQTYYWRVQAAGDGGDSNWSSAQSFTTETETSGDVSSSRSGDEAALEDLYVSMNRPNMTGWGTDMSLADDIEGVTVARIDGELRVTQIDLRGKGLTGSLDNESLGNLKKMTLWNSAQNSFDTQYPSALHQCTSLEYLYITYSDGSTSNTEVLPHEVLAGDTGGNLNYTHPGKWHGNEESIIRGSVPDDIDNLVNLKFFYLAWTDDWGLDGTAKEEPVTVNGIQNISQNIWNINTLKGINIYENWNIAASGNEFNFPASINHITNFALLYANGGGGTRQWDRDEQGFLKGTYPSDMGDLTDMRALIIPGSSQLSGFPDLSGSTGLQSLIIAFADMTGSMPAWAWDGTLTEIDTFMISWPQGDKMAGEFPDIDPEANYYLDLFTITDHNFSGEFPYGLMSDGSGGNGADPKKFNLGQNKLTSFAVVDWSNMFENGMAYFYRNDIEGQKIPILDWSRLNSAGGPRNETLAEQYGQGIRAEGNRYVFADMLYVPYNSPDGKNAWELYQVLESQGVRVNFSNQRPAGTSNTYDQSVGSSLTIDDFQNTYTHEDNNYQWQKDGSEISGATDRTLILNDITDSDAGTYTLLVTNPGIPNMTLTSQPVKVSIN